MGWWGGVEKRKEGEEWENRVVGWVEKRKEWGREKRKDRGRRGMGEDRRGGWWDRVR